MCHGRSGNASSPRWAQSRASSWRPATSSAAGDLQVVVGCTQIAAAHSDQLVRVAARERQPDHRLGEPEPLRGPAIVRGVGDDLVPARLNDPAVLIDAGIGEHLGIGGRAAVEPVQLGGQLQLDEASGQRDRVGSAFGAGSQVQIAKPLGDLSEPAVGIVHVLDRLVGAAMGVLGQHRHRVRLPGVAQLLERADDVVHLAGPSGGFPVVHEVVVGGERHVDPLAPRAQLRSLTPSRTGLRRQALAQPPIRLDLFEQQVDQPFLGEAGHVAGEIALLRRVRHSPQTRAHRLVGPVSVEQQGHRHAVLAERAVLCRRARAPPRRLAVVGHSSTE